MALLWFWQPMQRLAVYCGSRCGHAPAHGQAAQALGQAMAQRGVGLVYGAAQIGLMRAVADAVLAADGEVIGVIPEALMDAEVAHHELTRLEVVADMHVRKARMIELADAMVALPGGLGTLEELFEALTWLQLRFHSKPCALFNVDGYYDGLLQFLDGAVADGFVAAEHRALLSVHRDPQQLLDQLFPNA
ncbi:TIGR00730 family Rossman fold protein [Synechococcus sp. A15-28]|uniref:LOG family protein n=1 Tax=Synechococcus sp. A15-28 TaxID=1050638 RepID=UPI0018614667|nr:TIGR00730 family Rossman fold protein [Synechococcus sp. A15-28]QNI42243.1 cytokinin riboside 5'-monophosphate phosphoribohydrolase family protein [Synechococcus sp. A15-28]